MIRLLRELLDEQAARRDAQVEAQLSILRGRVPGLRPGDVVVEIHQRGDGAEAVIVRTRHPGEVTPSQGPDRV